MEIKIYNNSDFTVEVNEKKLIHFEYGIPGFEDLKKFAIIEIEEYNPFLLLHSVEDFNIAMIVLNAGLIDLEEDIEISEEKFKELNDNEEHEVGIFLILKIKGDDKEISANTKAPVLINFQNKKGKQIILDNENLSMDYPITIS